MLLIFSVLGIMLFLTLLSTIYVVILKSTKHKMIMSVVAIISSIGLISGIMFLIMTFIAAGAQLNMGIAI